MNYVDTLNHNIDLWNSKSREFINKLGVEFNTSTDPRERLVINKITDMYAKTLEDIHKNWKISEVEHG